MQQTEQFSKLDGHVQHVIRNLSEHRVTIEQIVLNEGERTRQHVSQRFEALSHQHHEEELQKKFLDSLRYSEIHARQEQIPAAYEDTYDWIFRDSVADDRPWADFTRWLEHGQDIYWINGKPGAGKSTLMNYIAQHERTKRALDAWAPRQKLAIPTFFFWNAGSNMQKSVNGLLRSLIFQLLSICPELLKLLKVRRGEIKHYVNKLPLNCKRRDKSRSGPKRGYSPPSSPYSASK